MINRLNSKTSLFTVKKKFFIYKSPVQRIPQHQLQNKMQLRSGADARVDRPAPLPGDGKGEKGLFWWCERVLVLDGGRGKCETGHKFHTFICHSHAIFASIS